MASWKLEYLTNLPHLELVNYFLSFPPFLINSLHLHVLTSKMSSPAKYDVLENESVSNLADINSELLRESRGIQSKHQRLSSYLLWYSAFSTTIVLVLSILLLLGGSAKNFPVVNHTVSYDSAELCEMKLMYLRTIPTTQFA